MVGGFDVDGGAEVRLVIIQEGMRRGEKGMKHLVDGGW